MGDRRESFGAARLALTWRVTANCSPNAATATMANSASGHAIGSRRSNTRGSAAAARPNESARNPARSCHNAGPATARNNVATARLPAGASSFGAKTLPSSSAFSRRRGVGFSVFSPATSL